jgi:hypothetical protein
MLRVFGTAIVTATLCFALAVTTGWGRSVHNQRAETDILVRVGDYVTFPRIKWSCDYLHSTGAATFISLDCLPTAKTLGLPRVTIYRDRVVVDPLATRKVTFRVRRQ